MVSKQLAALGFDQAKIMLALGVMSEQRTIADQTAYLRGYDDGYEDGVKRGPIG